MRSYQDYHESDNSGLTIVYTHIAAILAYLRGSRVFPRVVLYNRIFQILESSSAAMNVLGSLKIW